MKQIQEAKNLKEAAKLAEAADKMLILFGEQMRIDIVLLSDPEISKDDERAALKRLSDTADMLVAGLVKATPERRLAFAPVGSG